MSQNYVEKHPAEHRTAHRADYVAQRVAARSARIASSQLALTYHERYEALRSEVAHNKTHMLGATPNLWAAWFLFYRAGREWGAHVVDHLALPPRSAKSVEMAVRLFAKTYPRGKSPEIVSWFEANEGRFDLLDQAQTWPERSEETGVFQEGPFTVHNVVQASGSHLEDARDIIQRATRAASGSGVPGLGSVVHGQLYLVGQLDRKSWAAWYVPAKDAIYLRPDIRGISISEAARHLVHELGHRYWSHKLGASAKSAWNTHHYVMSRHSPDHRLPEVGEVLPFIVNRKNVRVEAVTSQGVELVDVKSGAPVGTVSRSKMIDWMQQIDLSGEFPSRYAATSAEEHFCESLSFFVFGTLAGTNLAAFNQIILGAGASSEHQAGCRVPSGTWGC